MRIVVLSDYNTRMDSLLSDIATKRRDAEAEIRALRARIESLMHDLSDLDKAEAAVRGQSLTVFQSLKPKQKPPKVYRTIKEMALAVLEDYPNGLVALDILSEINSRFEQSYVRTSLSPQLSRLRQGGFVHKSGKRWVLGKNRFAEAKM